MPKTDQNKPKVLSKNLFPVVGIGASAGGLDAFKKLITAIPENSGMAYILVQHLAAEFPSALPEILQRATKIPVLEISDNVTVDPNNIYVIPSNKILVATDGVLQLSPRPSKGHQNLPIDIFFSSLAEVHQSHAIGVVLSGTGADGTAGLKDIKNHGGLTFAQDLESAAYQGMPQHAIDAEVVDFILAPDKIPAKLVELQQSFDVLSSGDSPDEDNKTIEEAFRQILALLRVRVGVDFTYYKQTTIRRRIIRRALMLKIANVPDYLNYLKKNKPEGDILFQDLLIPVTSFFRDPKVFANLCETIIPQIVKNKSAVDPLRIWIAGCSTGQEAYSVAICLHEYLSDKVSNIKVQIFATDISERSIIKARGGSYSKKELEGISDSHLQHYFNKVNGHYQVKKPVRDMCIFAVHNFLKDPPFAKIDLISCRNVLIYLEPFLQKKVFTIFHYSLNDKGVLWLGKSEAITQSSDLFAPLGKKDKFYTRKPVPGRFTNVVGERAETVFTNKNDALRNQEVKADDFQKNADEILLSKYTPVGVVVNEHFDIVQFRGFTGKYLEPSPGKASLNVLKMAKEGLAFEIRNGLHKAKATSEPFIKEGISINSQTKLVTIEVIPLLNTIDLHYLILFREQGQGEMGAAVISKRKGLASKTNEKDTRIQQLERELVQAREDMRSITEDQEASNEELQSSNEELLSGSEELQSLNEELETSKEELQSTNEELITVNQELNDSNDELFKSRRFAEATIATLHEPLLVLDKNFVIKSANASFYKTFQLTEEDTLGNVLFELQGNGWDIPGLRHQLEKVQHKKVKTAETEVTYDFPSIGERTICFNIQPIDSENGKQLIVLALNDITLTKKVAEILEEKATIAIKSRQTLHDFFMQTPALLCILKGPEHVFELANPTYHQTTGSRVLVGKKLIEALPELGNQGFVEILDKVYETGQPFTGNEMPILLENVSGKKEQYFMNINYQALNDTDGNREGVLVFAYDVTEQVRARRQLEQNAEMIHNLYMNAPAFMCTLMGPEHTYTLVNPSYQNIFGKRQLTGKPIMEAIPELEGQGFDTLLDKVYQTGETYIGKEVPTTVARDEGLLPELQYFNFSYQPIYDDEKKINGVLVFGYEVTEEIRGRKMQEENDARFRSLADAMPQKVWTADAEGRVNYFNQQWMEYTHKSFEELKNWGWTKIIHRDDWLLNQQTWQHSIDTGEDFQLEHRFLHHDGSYRWHLSRGLAQKDGDGKVLLWLGTHTDINDQKAFAEELKKQIADKIKIEKQKNDFIGMASHELKTPVTSIKGYAQTLQRKFKNEGNKEAEGYLARMDKQVNKLTDLINDLLDATKVSGGQLKFTEEYFDFNELVKEIVEEIRQTSKTHSINIDFGPSEAIFGDRNRIGQVITNMLSNAIKYSPRADRVLVTTTSELH